MAKNAAFCEFNKQTFNFGSWNIFVQKSHILQSRCTNAPICDNGKAISVNISSSALCDFCKYEKDLDLPQLPEMTFASNMLRVEHDEGFGMEFNALDALQMVDSKNDLMKVAVADAWQESRLENSSIKEVIKPFDWTFSTEYCGTLINGDKSLKVSETEERINVEKLKVKAKILFYEDVILFEDELADNGTAQCSVKIRVMPDGFFILQRYFLRVDNLMIRIIDTRIYYEANKSHIIREHMTKESKIQDLKVPTSLLTNPSELWNHLPTTKFKYEKLEIPQ